MSSIQTGDEVRDFLKKLRDFMPDDLLVEILRLYGLRDVLAYAMNLDSKDPGPERIKRLIETKMGIEYIKIPRRHDYIMFNRDNQRVYGANIEFFPFGGMEMKIMSLSSDIKEVHEVSYGEDFDTLSEFFTNDELYFGTGQELVKLNYRDPGEEAKIVRHSMGGYVEKYLIDEEGELHGIYLESERGNTILFGVVSFFPSKEAFDFKLHVDLSDQIFQQKELHPFAMYRDDVYFRVVDHGFLPAKEQVFVYSLEYETFDSIPIDPNLKIMQIEVNANTKYLLVIAVNPPNRFVYHYFALDDHKLFSRQEITLSQGVPLLEFKKLRVMSDYNGDFFWINLDSKSELDYNVLMQRLVPKTQLLPTEQSDLLKEFTGMPISQQRVICHRYFEKM